MIGASENKCSFLLNLSSGGLATIFLEHKGKMLGTLNLALSISSSDLISGIDAFQSGDVFSDLKTSTLEWACG